MPDNICQYRLRSTYQQCPLATYNNKKHKRNFACSKVLFIFANKKPLQKTNVSMASPHRQAVMPFRPLWCSTQCEMYDCTT